VLVIFRFQATELLWKEPVGLGRRRWRKLLVIMSMSQTPVHANGRELPAVVDMTRNLSLRRRVIECTGMPGVFETV
jgi:hypothetical protein